MIMKGNLKMNYIIVGEYSPILTISLNKNELLSAKAGSDCWFSEHICEISSADNIIEALKSGSTEDKLFFKKYTSCADNAEITLIPDYSPCTIYPAQVSEFSPFLLAKDALLAVLGGAKPTPFAYKTFGDKRFELFGSSGSGTVFLQVRGNAVERTLADDETLIVRAEQLAACSESCKLEIYESNNDMMLKITGGEIVLSTAKNQ